MWRCISIMDAVDENMVAYILHKTKPLIARCHGVPHILLKSTIIKSPEEWTLSLFAVSSICVQMCSLPLEEGGCWGGGEVCLRIIQSCHGQCSPAVNLDWGGLWLYTDALLIWMTGMLISSTLPFKTQTCDVGFRTRRPGGVNFKHLFKYFIKM